MSKRVFRVCWRLSDSDHKMWTLVYGKDLEDAINYIKTRGLNNGKANQRWHKDMQFFGEDNVTEEKLIKWKTPKFDSRHPLFNGKAVPGIVLNDEKEEFSWSTLVLKTDSILTTEELENSNG